MRFRSSRFPMRKKNPLSRWTTLAGKDTKLTDSKPKTDDVFQTAFLKNPPLIECPTSYRWDKETARRWLRW